MKLYISLLLVSLTDCAAFNGRYPYSGLADLPYIEEIVEHYPIRDMYGMFTQEHYQKLAKVNNPYALPIYVDFDCNLHEWRNFQIPAQTSQYIMVTSNWRLMNVPQCHLLRFDFHSLSK